MNEPLPPELAAGLAATATRRRGFGDVVVYFAETGSTNDVAASLAERGAGEGTAVVASAQSAGRGRFGRAWASPPGAGLYLSVIIRDARLAPLLTIAGGVAVADGITRATGLPVQLKWPNDIVRPGPRKLAGILAEGSTGGAGLQHVVLGVGINLRPSPLPPAIASRATSIEAELGRPADDGAVLGEVLAAFAEACGDLRDGRGARVVERWRSLAPSATGSAVEWDSPAGPVRGTTAGVDADGALLVRTPAGVERVISGELRWTFKGGSA